MQEQSWVKLHRQTLENHFLMRDANAFLVFTKLLLMVGKQKGEWAGSVRELADKYHLNMNYMTLYKTLKRLEREGIVKLESKHKYTVITICKWATYQERRVTSEVTSGKQAGNTRVTRGKTQTGVKKPEKENKNKKENIGAKKTFLLSEILEPEFTEYVKMRKLARKPMTDHAMHLVVNKLEKMYPDDPDMQKLCLEQSILNNWQDVYEVKQSFINQKSVKRFA